MQTQNLELTPQQQKEQSEFRAFVDAEILPHADEFDREEYLPRELVSKVAQKGYWGATVPKAYGGAGMDMVTYGLLTEQVGRGCASARNLLGVQGMVAAALLRWGSREQKEYWLPKMAGGETIAAFALTEPEVGSDAKSITTSATRSGTDYVLEGSKKWTSFGQNADLFLVFAQCEGQPAAYLIEKGTPGFSSKPITGLLGFRASMLAELHLHECRVPQENMVGRRGFGLSHVAACGLTHGRYSTAWGCVGLAQACLEASLRYAGERKQFGTGLKEHELIQSMIADMVTDIAAARLLCRHVGHLQEAGDPGAVMGTCMAKYFASCMAVRVAMNAVQIHGANGCSADYPVQRYLRDAKISEVVEGSTQIQQVTIAKYAFQEYALHTGSK